MISIKILKIVGNIKVESYNVTKDGNVKVHFRNNFGTETSIEITKFKISEKFTNNDNSRYLKHKVNINVNTNYKKYKPS